MGHMHQSDPMSACTVYTAHVSHSPQHSMSMYAHTAPLSLSSVKKQQLMRQLLRYLVTMRLF